MKLKQLEENWRKLGEEDPMWAILTHEENKGNKWDEQEFFATGDKTIDGIVNKISKKYQINKFSSALDFGCGIGRLSRAMCKYSDEVYGVDIASSMIEKANEHNIYPDRCHYILNTKDDLSVFESNKFDLVITLITLQHMHPKFAFNYIKEFFRIMKKDGLLIFQLPHQPDLKVKIVKTIVPDFLINFYRRLKYSNQGIMEMYWTEEKDIRKLVEEGNLELLDVETATDTADWTHKRYYIRKK